MKKQKKTNKKKDLIPLSLFQIMSGKLKELNSLTKQLEKHLDENYKMKQNCSHYKSSFDKKVYPSDEAWESFVSECLWGDDFDAEQFDKELKKQSNRK